MIIRRKSFVRVTVAALMAAEILLAGCAAQKPEEPEGSGQKPEKAAAAASTQKPVEPAAAASTQKTDTPAVPLTPSETASAGSTEMKL